MPADSLRLQKELKDLAEDTNSGVSVEVGDILTHLTGTVLGPKDTPYEGGIFKVDIKLTDEYPFEAPKMNFITKVWYEKNTRENKNPHNRPLKLFLFKRIFLRER